MLAAFTDHLPWLIPVGVVLLFIAYTTFSESRRQKKLLARHLAKHAPLNHFLNTRKNHS